MDLMEIICLTVHQILRLTYVGSVEFVESLNMTLKSDKLDQELMRLFHQMTLRCLKLT